MERLQRPFFLHDALGTARDLLGALLVTNLDGCRTAGRIIETEAYLGMDDPASHAHRGPTKRNYSMFRRGGHAYVYFIYGMYYCFNVVTGAENDGQAVLIRSVESVEGRSVMEARRGARLRNAKDLTNGPGKLAIAFGITSELDGADLTTDQRIWIEPGDPIPDHLVAAGPRVGITRGTEHPWRWMVRSSAIGRT